MRNERRADDTHENQKENKKRKMSDAEDNIDNSNSHQDSSTSIQIQHIEPPVRDQAVTKARKDALQTLEAYRALILTLELTRIRKSRAGFAYLVAYWEWSWIRSSARPFVSLVSLTRSGIDTLFRNTAKELYSLMRQAQTSVLAAETEAEIAQLLNRLEVDAAAHTHRRRTRAKALLQKLRSCLFSASIVLYDQQFKGLTRAAFALDWNCDYHPGDARAEALAQFNSRPPEQTLNTIGEYGTTGRFAIATELWAGWEQIMGISRWWHVGQPKDGDEVTP
ncbi:hypothetical protein VTN77DRAFT_5133 [Rasamsonia byssochlamydoides]|uniref:uncharacterized protein n=1 Tax=Rasamsonia byssochlamydoides TaxID=89139 RepID=UPI003743BB22